MPEDVTNLIKSIGRRASPFEPSDDPQSLRNLEAFLQTTGIKGSSLERQVSEGLHPAPPPPGDFVAQTAVDFNGIRSRLRDIFSDQNVEILKEEEGWLPFRVHALYCPPVPGVKGSLKVVAETGEEASCQLKVLGVGGGPAFSLDFKVTDSFATDQSRSFEVYYEWKAVWQQCRVSQPPHEALVYSRLVDVKKALQRVRSRIVTVPATNPQWGHVTDDTEIDLTDAPGPVTRSFEIGAGTKWEASATVKIFGSELGPKYTATMSWTTVCELTLPEGHRYDARRFERWPWWWWKP